MKCKIRVNPTTWRGNPNPTVLTWKTDSQLVWSCQIWEESTVNPCFVCYHSQNKKTCHFLYVICGCVSFPLKKSLLRHTWLAPRAMVWVVEIRDLCLCYEIAVLFPDLMEAHYQHESMFSEILAEMILAHLREIGCVGFSAPQNLTNMT